MVYYLRVDIVEQGEVELVGLAANLCAAEEESFAGDANLWVLHILGTNKTAKRAYLAVRHLHREEDLALSLIPAAVRGQRGEGTASSGNSPRSACWAHRHRCRAG